jgi:hypothetical protein
MYFQSKRSARQEFSLNLSVCFPVEGSVFNQSHVSPFSLMSVIADGADEVRKAAREELRKGRPKSDSTEQRGSIAVPRTTGIDATCPLNLGPAKVGSPPLADPSAPLDSDTRTSTCP